MRTSSLILLRVRKRLCVSVLGVRERERCVRAKRSRPGPEPSVEHERGIPALTVCPAHTRSADPSETAFWLPGEKSC